MPAQLPRLSVLVPIYNNEATLGPLVERLRRSLQAWDYELILVDDGSRDGSRAFLARIAADDPRVKAISFSRNFGQHPAIAAALEHATGDVLVLMDADLEDQPEHIPSLLHELQSGSCDIVYTVKSGEARTARHLTSDAYHHAFSRAVGLSLPRGLGTFRAFTRKVRDALLRFPERHVVYGPLMFYVGFKFVIVPVERGPRAARSAYSFGRRLRLAVNSLVTYSDLPPKAFGAVGVAMVVLPLLYGAVVTIQYFAVGQSLPRGLTIVVLLLLLLGGMIMLALSVLGVYIFRIFQEVLGRPRYVIDETWNVGGPSDGRS